MSFLDQPGDLASVPLAAVLIEALNQRETGILTVEHAEGSSRVFMRDGIPIGAQSFQGFKPLGQVLLSAGLIDIETLGLSLAAVGKTGRYQGDVLVEMGAVTREQVDEALTKQQTGYLLAIAGLSSGRFSFDRVTPIPTWTAGIKIAPLQAIVMALEKTQASPLVVSALRPAASGALALAPGYQQLGGAFGFSSEESALVARLQGLTTLEAFFAGTKVAPERARAILAALLLLGLATPRDAPVESVEPTPGVVVDLVDLAGVPVEPPPRASVASAETPRITYGEWNEAVASTLRRGDPEEARRRRQRLLQRAMQNMGVGPLSGQQQQSGARRTEPPRPSTPPSPGVRSQTGAPTTAPAARAPTGAPASLPEQELRKALAAALPRARSADLFERLGIPPTATRDQVKSAYLNLARHLHPDRFTSAALADLAASVRDLFVAINEAYEILSDDRKRADYVARGNRTTPAPADRAAAAIDIQKAEACSRTRDHAKARAFYEAALRADPRPAHEAAFAWGIMMDPRGDRTQAKALARSALRDPDCDRAALICGLLARDNGDEDEAERMFRRALQANPRNTEADRELRLLEARRSRAKSPGSRKR